MKNHRIGNTAAFDKRWRAERKKAKAARAARKKNPGK